MQEANQVIRKLKWVSAVCFLFMAVQVVGGLVANSIAIMSDAMHLFSDLMAFAISAYSVWLSKQEAPSYLTFGYHKVQTIGALLNIAIIWVVTIILLIEATERVINKEVVKEPKWMLYTSIFGLVCNLVMVKIIHSDAHFKHEGCSHDHKPQAIDSIVGETWKNTIKPINAYDSIHDEAQHQHKHGSGCSHEHHSSEPTQQEEKKPIQKQFEPVQAHKCSGHDHHDHNHSHDLHDHEPKPISLENNLNIEAAYVHILGDIVQSIGVMISAGIIYYNSAPGQGWTHFQLADPLCTYLFSVLVALTTVKITKKSIIILLDGCCDPTLVLNLEKKLDTVPGLCEYSELRVRSVSTDEHLGSLKVVVKNQDVVQKVREVFNRKGVEVVIDWELEADKME